MMLVYFSVFECIAGYDIVRKKSVVCNGQAVVEKGQTVLWNGQIIVEKRQTVVR